MLTPAKPHAEPSHDAWHAVTCAETLERLGARRDGLTAAEASARLADHGPNTLPAGRARSAAARFLAQFNDLLIYVLLGSAAITIALAHWVDTAVILLVVLANAVIGFVQEGRAERALDAVRRVVTPRATVIRDGHRIAVAAEALVPGDWVLLEAGDRVPADIRIVRARNLRIEEALLTGESAAVEKGSDPVRPDAALGDRRSMAFSGTVIAAGQGAGVVVATGLGTELGRISSLLATVETLTTPLLRQMNRFARQLTVVILATSVAVFAFAVLARSYPWSEAFMAVVGLAVSAIPEGLPAVLTITLAIGVQRMAGRRAIIRRLPAVETLGSVSIICSDKTGTLTRNEMSVRSVVLAGERIEVGGVGYEPRGAFRRDDADLDPGENAHLMELTRAALLCNDASLRQAEDAWTVEGDAMEGALVALAVKAGHDADLVRRRYRRADEIPFDAEHRFMATLHHGHEEGAFVCVKGAPERLLEMCSSERTEEGERPLRREAWLRAIDALASQGQRVLAIATARRSDGTQELTMAELQSGLALLGLTGFIDPPRPEAVAAVRECRSAGIAVKMITGDHAVTAAAIAAELGISGDASVATGSDLDGLDERQFERAARDTTVFARTSPEHKLRLVEALQRDGAVVAMTGDGVNDAPALKRADIGVAMGGKGTEAAKEAAEMVLADDNFATIVAAVREGRTVYDNLRKVIAWTLPTNGGEALIIIGAILVGMTLPVTPVQILWINLVTAIALGLTLAFEPAEADIMRRAPRRPGDSLLGGYLVWRILFVATLFGAGAFTMFELALARGLELEAARTIVVNTIVVLEVFYLFSVRYVRSTSLTWRGVLGTPAVLTGVSGVVLAQLAFTYVPFMQRLFDTRAVAWRDGITIIGVGVALLLVLEAEKRVMRTIARWRGQDAAPAAADDERPWRVAPK